MDKKDLLLYFNFINLQNKIILDFCENLDMDNFFDLDRKIFENLSFIYDKTEICNDGLEYLIYKKTIII